MNTSEPIVRQEKDRLRTRTIGRVIIVGLLAFGAGTATSGWLLRLLQPQGPGSSVPSNPGRTEQGLLPPVQRGLDMVAEQRRWLAQSGVVDRDAGVAHISIDLAMDLVAAEGSR